MRLREREKNERENRRRLAGVGQQGRKRSNRENNRPKCEKDREKPQSWRKVSMVPVDKTVSSTLIPTIFSMAQFNYT